jgi:hypothetical protein
MNTPSQITAKEFYAMTLRNPSIFKDWNTPLEITEYVNCKGSKITHLSRHLTFTESNEEGWSANFSHCKALVIATGTFYKYVNFENSNVQKIENLIVGKDYNWDSASFKGCSQLQTATGNFVGFVDFSESGITKIENLNIKNPGECETYANFFECPNLQSLGDWNLSNPIIIESKKAEAEKERRALQKFQQETQPKPLPFL